MIDAKQLIRVMQNCGVAYVSGPNIGACQRCGFREDRRMGACFDCSPFVDGEYLGDGVHKLWDKTRPDNVWVIWVNPPREEAGS